MDTAFPWWLQVTHFLNFLFIGLLLRSGFEILASHPRLYWNNNCHPGNEWLKFTKDKVPLEVGAFTARDDQRQLHPLLSLPGRGKIGIGRAWHGLVTMAWVVNGLIYVVLLFATGQWRRIVPTSWDVIPEAWESMKIYAGFGVPSIEHFQPYDALQMLGYTFIVFVVAPLMIVTGPVMSPAVVGRYPWYAKLFGGRQAARSIHFIGMAMFVGFVVMHVALVFLVHPEHNLVHMMMGVEYDPALVAQAVTRTVVGVGVVVALWVAASYLSLVDVRKSQRVLYRLQMPIKKWVLNPMTSTQRAKQVFTEDDISPFHWVNTRPPDQAQSPEWLALEADDFADFRLRVGGSSRRRSRSPWPSSGRSRRRTRSLCTRACRAGPGSPSGPVSGCATSSRRSTPSTARTTSWSSRSAPRSACTTGGPSRRTTPVSPRRWPSRTRPSWPGA